MRALTRDQAIFEMRCRGIPISQRQFDYIAERHLCCSRSVFNKGDLERIETIWIVQGFVDELHEQVMRVAV